MKLQILAVGNKMPSWVSEAFGEYAKRMPREAQLQLIEIKPEKRVSGKNTQQILDAERDRILPYLVGDSEKLVLDERGAQWTTVELAKAISGWQRNGRDVTFVIGGADGLHDNIKRAATRLLALSALTLPHAMVRVLLAEQLYRAISINQNHPYHRE